MVDMTKYAESEYLTIDKIKSSKTKDAFIVGDVTELDGKFGKKAEFLIEIDQLRKKWNPSKESVNFLILGFGSDSKAWLGKRIIFSVELGKDNKERIVAKPY